MDNVLGVFVALFGALLLVVHVTLRTLLRHAAEQGIYLDYNEGWLQFIGWLGMVVLLIGVALLVTHRRKRK